VLDKYKLEYEMKSKGVTVDKLCKDLKISRSAYYRKMSGKTQFTLEEIQQIVEYLGLDSPMGIFFTEKVS
jgi:transcriptional regulator with XRE-family HTH domain